MGTGVTGECSWTGTCSESGHWVLPPITLKTRGDPFKLSVLWLPLLTEITHICPAHCTGLWVDQTGMNVVEIIKYCTNVRRFCFNLAVCAGISFRIHGAKMHVFCPNMLLKPNTDACQKHAFWVMYLLCFYFQRVRKQPAFVTICLAVC